MATYTNEDIIHYVEDELSSEEKQKMEEDLRTDVALAERVAMYRQLKGTLEQRLPADKGVAALRQTLTDMRGKYFSGGTGTGKVVKMKRGYFRYIAGMAAAAVILFTVVMLWPSDYLGTYGKTQMAGVTERGEGNDTLMERAAEYFNGGEFGKALPLLDMAYRKDSTDRTALFYRGVARLHTGSMEEARQDLQTVYNGESLFRYEAAFYIALSYAQQKNMSVALQWLDRIPAGAPSYDRAKELRKKIE